VVFVVMAMFCWKTSYPLLFIFMVGIRWAEDEGSERDTKFISNLKGRKRGAISDTLTFQVQYHGPRDIAYYCMPKQLRWRI